MAGISGAAVADAAALGTMLIPAMNKSGYSRPYATALTGAASIIGPTIPPSMAMIVYGSVANTSIAGLFATGFLPGLFLGLLMMVLNHFISSRRGYQMQQQKASLGEVFRAMKDGLFALGMPLIILGGILSGIFTPTEAAGVAVGYSLFVGLFIFRTLTLSMIWQALKKTISISGVALLLVSVGGILSWVLTVAQVPQTIAAGILGITGNKYVFLLLVCALLLVVGCFMDLTASIVILTPILAPIAAQMGIHPLHFGALRGRIHRTDLHGEHHKRDLAVRALPAGHAPSRSARPLVQPSGPQAAWTVLGPIIFEEGFRERSAS